ncbi:MAG: hypothetical protein ABI983_01120 [Acidobacteriota bacterium]
MWNLKSAAVIAALFFFAACGAGSGGIGCNAGSGSGPRGSRAKIVLNADSPRPTIDVVDVPPDQLALIAGADTREAWSAILKVAVGIDQPAAVGQYSIANNIVRFTPMFPLDKGRQYHVTFTAPGAEPITATVGLPPPDTTPTTSVAEVYPTADVVPENQLRLYIHFSAPMGSRGALDFVRLLDDSGQEVKDPFLPLDVEFWNDDRTRYTVFFDPGRQKRGIAPIDQMGRSLTAGKTYTLVVDAAWPDGKGLPLKQSFKRTFTVGPPDEKPLDSKTWRIDAPASADAPLVVTFPEPLDHGLLLRALGVLAGGKPLEGSVVVSNHELTWTFTPAEPWKPGAYNLVAFAMLEDLAGNRIGRAFEVDQFDRTDQSNEPEKTLIPFSVR